MKLVFHVTTFVMSEVERSILNSSEKKMNVHASVGGMLNTHGKRCQNILGSNDLRHQKTQYQQRCRKKEMNGVPNPAT